MTTHSDPDVFQIELPVPESPPGDRYRGDDHDVTLAALHPDDQRFLRDVYGRLEGFYQIWRTDPGHPPWDRLAAGVATLADPELREDAQGFGIRTRAGSQLSEHMQRVLHDVRGGGLSAALAEAEILSMAVGSEEALAGEREGLLGLVYLARDHAKMMRNAILGIDTEGRARDEEERPHHIGDLVRRWDGRLYRVGDRAARVRARMDRDGGLSSCCLEASAVDRILYNLIGNAARFAPDGEVALDVRHVAGDVVRIAVANRVTEDQAAWLSDALEGDPGALYRAGVTRGGQGYGLANVAHFVTAAFGADGTGAALDRGLLGGRLTGDRFVTWFHWPALDAAPARTGELPRA